MRFAGFSPTTFSVLVLSLSLMVGLGHAETGTHAGRPNILFLFADDWGRHASIYPQIDGKGGVNDVVRTPNFDRLAKRGVLFRNAHVNAPSCTPCRSSLLSGQYFWRTGRGAILRGAVWDPQIPAFPLLLRDSGYQIGKSYKVWSPGMPVDAPFGGQQHAFEKRGRRFNLFSQNATQLISSGMGSVEAKQALYDEVLGNFRDFLDSAGEGKPFCYWFGPTNVHRPFERGSGKALWNLNPDELKGKMPPYLPDVPVVREDLTDYFGEIEAWDHAIGLHLAELERCGRLENTLVVISGDHGAPGFPHGKCNLYGFGTGVALAIAGPGVQPGRVVDDFVNLADLAPSFLEAGSLPIPARMTGRSLWPLLKSKKSGQIDPARTWVVTGRERHVEIARPDYSPYPQRALRTADHVLIVNFHPERWPLGDPYRLSEAEGKEPSFAELADITHLTLADEDASPSKAWLIGARKSPQWAAHFNWVYGKRPELELYDLKKDPHETTNVATDPDYASILEEMKGRLFAELRSSGDPRMIDGGAYFETPPLAGPLPDGKAFWQKAGAKGKSAKKAAKAKAANPAALRKGKD